MLFGFRIAPVFPIETATKPARRPACGANYQGTIKEVKMNIYVGNLSNDVSEADLRQAFEPFGEVSSARVIKDKYSGASRGFGFVEMPAKSDAEAAIAGLQDKDLKGRALKVNEARPRPDAGGGARGPARGGRGGGMGQRDDRGGRGGRRY
jgi:RNA recognition motif-containing protein